MKSDVFNNLEEIKGQIDFFRKYLNGKHNERDKQLVRKVMQKHVIISIYTAWENFIKDYFYKVFEENENMLISTSFIQKYFTLILESPYFLRNEFIADVSIDGIKVKKTVLCSSNNMTLEEAIDIVKRLGLSVDELMHILSISNDLKESYLELQSLEIIPIIDVNNNNQYSYISGYVKSIVESRNLIAHEYNLTTSYSVLQFRKLLDFIEKLTRVIIQCVESEIGKLKTKYILEHEAITGPIEVLEIIRSSTGNTNPIVVVNVGEYDFFENDEIIIHNHISGTFQIGRIFEIRNEEMLAVKDTVKNKRYSLEIKTDNKVKRKNTYSIHKIKNIVECNDKKQIVIIGKASEKSVISEKITEANEIK